MIRHFKDRDEDAVNKVYAACHPAWPAPRPGFWWGHPTLVLVEDGEIIGATAFCVAAPPSQDVAGALAKRNLHEAGWGHGVYVHPSQRGHGYGWILATARHEALLALGVTYFFGMTQPTNTAMLAIFKRQRLSKIVTVPKIYPDGSDGLLFAGEIL